MQLDALLRPALPASQPISVALRRGSLQVRQVVPQRLAEPPHLGFALVLDAELERSLSGLMVHFLELGVRLEDV